MQDLIITYVTVEKKEEAHKIAEGLVKNKLAACVNIIPGVHSHYLWEGDLCNSEELVLFIKTKESLFTKLKDFICQNHSYETPCILKIPFTDGHLPYLKWLTDSLKS